MGKKKRQNDPHANSDQSSTDSNDEKTMDGQKEDCPHISRSIDNAKLRKNIKLVGLQTEKCTECDKMTGADGDNSSSSAAAALDASIYEEEIDYSLWLCLRCGTQLCGRFRNKHAAQHYATPRSDSHSVVLNTTTFQLWCYDCDSDIAVPRRKKQIYELIEFIKDERNKLKKAENINCISSVLSIGKTLQETISSASIQNSLIPQQNNEIASIASTANNGSTLIETILIPQQQKSVGSSSSTQQSAIKELPRVRGLTNLGNTCFFNAVLQCLARTPYLIHVLNTASTAGENFELPGGNITMDSGEIIELAPIKGELSAWYPLTEALHETLTELQKSGGTHNPMKLFNLLIKSRPQFSGGDQHDSHELLRHLLEAVRTEDLKRYQQVILESLKLKKTKNVNEDMKKKCKLYGGQADKRILIPEQVFRGYLVSTLICQDCCNVSPRFESFLDISLPVNVEKSQPPAARRKNSPEPICFSMNNKGNKTSHNVDAIDTAPQQQPSKKEQRNKKKKMRKVSTKITHTKQSEETTIAVTSTNNITVDGVVVGTASIPSSSSLLVDGGECDGVAITTPPEDSASSSSGEQSDADVEDNLTDDKSIDNRRAANRYDTNGNSTMEKIDDRPENENKDVNIDDHNIAKTGGGEEIQTQMHELTISEKGRATLVRQSTSNDDIGGCCGAAVAAATANNDRDEKIRQMRRRTRIRTNSYTDWSTTLASRYKCDENECSVQSCLSGFTAVELMCGNNKVGCDSCTKIFNGENGKTYNTNATKQFLISSPPAVMILHLKRFQVGPRYMFRKLSKPVGFPFILDVAPFCATNVKKLPNVKRHQKKLIYSLYGIVEHSGSMHGGHYTAYVKVRSAINADDPRWNFIPKGSKAELAQSDEQEKRLESDLEKSRERERRAMAHEDADDSDDSFSSSSSSSDHQSTQPTDNDNAVEPDIKPLPGKWYYVSDSQVREVNEDDVQTAQAYLLFYERIY